MDLRNLEKLLHQCIDPCDQEHIRAKESLIKHAQELGWEHVEGFMYHDLSKKIQEELESLPFYQDYEGCFVNMENGAYGFHPSMVAPDLVHMAFKRGIKAALSYFSKMTCLPYADGYSTILLLGIDLDNSFEVYPGITLSRIEDLPNSTAKDHYIGDEIKWHRNSPHSVFIRTPKCALVRKIRIEPLTYRAGNKPINKKPLESDELFKEITLLLTLLGPSPVLTSVHWFEFEDQDLQGVNPGGGGWHNYEIFPIILPEILPVATESICNSISSYFKISNLETKEKIKVSLERLSSSLLRRSSGDAALELSIALETIFAGDRGEITYKIGLRAALLISQEFDERKRVRSIISALYDHRSDLVHRGINSDTARIKGFEPVNSNELIKESSIYVSRAIEKILELGSIPDWNEYELKEK